MAFLDLLLLAAIAAFLGYRLWAVLGTHEKDKPIRKRRSSLDDDVIPVRSKATKAEKATETKAEQATDTEMAPPETMDRDRFLQGAEIAFRKIVEAYAFGDMSTLGKLLDRPLLETFQDAIQKREKNKQTLEVFISRIVKAEILDKREEKDMVYITVRFVSEQCLVTRNSKGQAVQGDPDRYIEVTDIWTFARPLDSSNPNWKLVATQIDSN